MVNVFRIGFLAFCIASHGCARAQAPEPQRQEPTRTIAQSAKVDLKSPASLDTESARQANHRVIRNAELVLEAQDQPVAEQRILLLAERLGGYTVNSERHQSDDGHGAQTLGVDIVVRIPSAKFREFLTQAGAQGERVDNETTTAQDVTEEFIDLEARIVTERALEAQYLEIMKQSKSVKDALEVHAQLAGVREQIEKTEGRKHFLENQTSLSTVHVSILKYVPEIRAHGFGIVSSVRSAASDVLEVGAFLLIGTIRTLGFLVPIGAVLGAPLFFLLRLARARIKKNRVRILAKSTAAD